MSSVFEVLAPGTGERAERVEQLRQLGFAWADLEDEEYWLDQIVVMNGETYRELEEASSRLWGVLDKTVRYVHKRRDLYELIGIPQILWDMLDDCLIPGQGLISRYARFDYAVGHDGSIKLYELNADTPTGYVEASIATPWLCGEAGISTPNGRMKELVKAAWAVERPDTAACVAYGSHLEDSGTIEALVKHSGLPVTCVDCLDLWIDEGIVKDATGREIKRMFALYPKEWMTSTTAETRSPMRSRPASLRFLTDRTASCCSPKDCWRRPGVCMNWASCLTNRSRRRWRNIFCQPTISPCSREAMCPNRCSAARAGRCGCSMNKVRWISRTRPD